jgi:hypothetical protein
LSENAVHICDWNAVCRKASSASALPCASAKDLALVTSKRSDLVSCLSSFMVLHATFSYSKIERAAFAMGFQMM